MALVEPAVYGDLRILPWDFERLTRREVELMLDGARRRQKARTWLMALLASWLLAPWAGKSSPRTPEQLLGWSQDWERRG